MPIEGFDYQNFAQLLSGQAGDLVPADFTTEQKNYVVKTLHNFSMLAGEALFNDASIKLDANQAMFITQVIAEWSFHKSVDLIKSGVAPEFLDSVLQKIAFTIFEITKQTIAQGIPQEQILQIVEQHVQKTYTEALAELKEKGAIDESLYDKAAHQSNIDEMMNQIQQEKQSGSQEAQGASNDSKILKLASVALLLRQLSQDKVKSILNKFNPQDAQLVIQYMQMPDLEQKVDKDIALKCLREIKTNLPEPKKINPNKILAKFGKVLAQKGKVKIANAVVRERSNVKDFVKNAYEGEYFQIPSKVANIIVKHLEETA